MERLRSWFRAEAPSQPLWLIPIGAVLYTALGIFSLETLTVDAVSPLWPGAGIGLLLALWFGWRGLAALWIADVMIGVLGPVTVGVALPPATATAVAVEAGVGAALIVSLGVNPALRTTRDTVGFVASIAVAGAIGAALGAVALVTAGAGSNFFDAFGTWWLSDVCGAFLVGGLGLVIPATRLPGAHTTLKLAGALTLVAITAAALNLIGDAAPVALIPAVTLAAVIGRGPGALASGVVAAAVALPFAEDGASGFAGRGAAGIFELEFILTAMTITVLVLAATLDARDDAIADLTARAATDELTGLSNRFGLEIHLRGIAAAEVGLIVFSIDRFRLIKSGLGYEAGDRFLVETGSRLATVAPAGGRIARLEGDEFAVLHEPEANRGETIALAEKALALLSRPFKIEGHTVTPTISAGIAWTRPHEALSDAAIALHDAKTAGGGRWRLSRSGAHGSHPLRREAQLREAISNGQVVPYFQPIVCLGDKCVASCEALARWHHPRRGLLNPADFVPVAEQGEVIHELGARMLQWACEEAARWPSRISVAVNISARQLHPGLAEQVEAALSNAGIGPERLQLELTETAVLDQVDADATLRALRRTGVTLALDDFGTGWSSFEIAQALRVDRLKIDRSFVARIGENGSEAALIAAMVAMARAIGADIVAEGVETLEQHETLVELGVDAAQGYLYSHPVPSAELAEFLTNRADWAHFPA
ncbi:MAG TPA: EAL domain-containing protein [Solirubrobacterales bacterium]|nr:EAL domain-containing protein [Solirubrobacterales bacterium]